MTFQRRWWRFERCVWLFFIALIILDLMGAFGRGILAMASQATADRSLETTYERIERSGTPSMMTVKIDVAENAHDVELYVSDSAISGLGLQRVIPAPEITKVGKGGFTYQFPIGSLPATVRFEFQPVAAGMYHVAMGVPGKDPIQVMIAVVP